MRRKVATFGAFKERTLAVARGEQGVDPKEPRIWVEPVAAPEGTVQFRSLEAGAKLLSAKNRALLRLIATRAPQSVHELAVMAQRAPQNVQRTLHRLREAGVIRLTPGPGRTLRPVLTARKVHIEIEL